MDFENISLENVSLEDLLNDPKLNEFLEYIKASYVFWFDFDGTLMEWKDIKIPVPENAMDMSESELADYYREETYKILLSPDYYKNLEPYANMIAFANFLHDKGFDVRGNSCTINNYTSTQKKVSITAEDRCPWMTGDKLVLIPDGQGKQKYMGIPFSDLGKCNVLIDDHTPNCIGWEKGLGNEVSNNFAIKVKNDINMKKGTWKGPVIDINLSPEENFSILVNAIRETERIRDEREKTDIER